LTIQKGFAAFDISSSFDLNEVITIQ